MQSGIDFLISFLLTFMKLNKVWHLVLSLARHLRSPATFTHTYVLDDLYAHQAEYQGVICVDFSDKLGSPSLSRWSPLLSWLRWCWYLWSLRYRPKPTRVSMVAMRHGKLVSRAVDLIWTLVYCAPLWWMNAGTRVKEKENPFNVFATSNPGTGRRKPGKMMMMSQWRTKRRGLDEGLYAKELCVAGLVFRKWHPIILLKLEFHQDNNRSVRVASLNTCATV